MTDDLATRYQDYLARCARELPAIEVGAFAKYGGRLIKKLAFEEFAAAYREYSEMRTHYVESLERGDTVNDAVRRALREKAAALILAPPA